MSIILHSHSTFHRGASAVTTHRRARGANIPCRSPFCFRPSLPAVSPLRRSSRRRPPVASTWTTPAWMASSWVSAWERSAVTAKMVRKCRGKALPLHARTRTISCVSAGPPPGSLSTLCVGRRKAARAPRGGLFRFPLSPFGRTPLEPLRSFEGAPPAVVRNGERLRSLLPMCMSCIRIRKLVLRCVEHACVASCSPGGERRPRAGEQGFDSPGAIRGSLRPFPSRNRLHLPPATRAAGAKWRRARAGRRLWRPSPSRLASPAGRSRTGRVFVLATAFYAHFRRIR